MNRLKNLVYRKLSLRKLLFVIIVIAVFYSSIQLYYWSTTEYGNAGSINYFLDGNASKSKELLVDTPTCKILKMSPWDDAILPFIKPSIKPPQCQNNAKNWTYLNGTILHINETAVKSSGYSMSSIRCCYKEIIRVEETLESHSWDADNVVKYSVECHKMEPLTDLNFEFIRVFCTSTSWPYLGEVVYRSFHAVAKPTKERTKEKIKYWEEKTQQRPPNVVMIGIDSISRMNYHRSFPKTRAFLQKIGAVELLGYTKVGENTHPNTAAFLTGYDMLEMTNICMKSPDIPQDFCPYIWKRFDEENFLTATVEDAPGLVGFNYLKLGFVQQPTDFYFRPFMLAVHKSLPRKDYYHTDCIGTKTTEETLLNYIAGISSLASSAPVFVHSWFTSLAHLDINGARFADESVSYFLQSLDLSNTVLIFLSDHGQRYGAIRETLAGWYEDKLPVITLFLPPTVQAAHPDWMKNLRRNSQRLTSPFDLYQSMEHILFAYSSNNLTLQTRKYGESLFLDKINQRRRCKDAGIKINYCSCIPPRRVNVENDPNVLLAVTAAVNYLNEQVPKDVCATTELDRVLAAAVLEEEGDKEGSYVVTFYTNPGQFMFEATVDFVIPEYGSEKVFKVNTDLLRMNKISRSASCVDSSLLERYCYCL